MSQKHRYWSYIAVALMLAGPRVGLAQLGGLLPSTGTTQTITGSGTAVQATVLGATSTLTSTGTLTNTSDARDAGSALGSIPGVLGAEALNASTIGWPDQVDSEASVANLGVSIAGTSISADFVMARVSSIQNSAASGITNIDNLSINGVPITVTGNPNQTVSIPGGAVIINEQTTSLGSTTVNALHVVVTGVADMVIASAKAGIS